MTLYIIRHGETDMNREGIVQGSGVDSDLNNTGRKQAKLFFQYYKNVPFDFIVTSALKRTHQTVNPFVAKGDFKEWIQTPDLNEISWGEQEGKKSTPEMHEKYKILMKNWESGNYHVSLEAGETAAQLHERVTRTVSFFEKHYVGKNVLVCTHGRTLLCLLTILKNEPLSMMSQFRHQNTCLYKVHRVENEWIFELENDVRHLGQFQTVNF